MVWALILCSRLATRESQTALRGDRQAGRRERAGVERRGLEMERAGSHAGRLHRETHSV